MEDAKVVFICHPISGDVVGNLREIRKILRTIYKDPEMKHIIPQVPYYASLLTLNDNIKEDRERGMLTSLELLSRGAFDEVWVFSEDITPGMQKEIMMALNVGIPVIPKEGM